MSMFVKQRLWPYFRQHRVASIVAGHVIVMSILGLVLLNSAFGGSLFGAFAAQPCGNGAQTYVVRSGDTLGAVAGRFGTTWQQLASYNHLANPNTIFVNQHICIPGASSGKMTTDNNMPGGLSTMPIPGTANLFPAGQCTWWANQRYFQLHGVFVPWTTNSNAYQWVARANDFHWVVSSTPTKGSIMVLQPFVDGASSLGHVGVVESVSGNHVIASSLNWGTNPTQVTDFQFAIGSGVSFVSV
ncbi:MAG TPA: LysM peptidoglycan-binding domain-containing protein [Dictyobacter sp.]|jgi:surface antigen|nr:LysM peptidoglycan-binding domain-containing protein [Dictyobacter sp.]